MELDLFFKSASLLLLIGILGVVTMDLPRVNGILIGILGVGATCLAFVVFLEVWGLL